MFYFLITSGEDGTEIKQYTKAKLLEILTEDGAREWEFLDKIPSNDKGCWYDVGENAVLIIKGEIIKPKTVQVATRFEL